MPDFPPVDGSAVSRVVEIVRESYGLRLDSLVPLGGGLDTLARTYCAECDGNKYVVKLRPDFPSGIRLSGQLRSLGLVEVVAPLVNRFGDQATLLGRHTLLLYPFMEGSDHPSNESPEWVWETIGRILRTIHDTDVDSATLMTESFRVSGVQRFEERRERIARGHFLFAGEERLSSVLASRDKEIARVAARVHELGAWQRERKMLMVPCHADLHAYNILVSTRSVHIIDWDTARMAPRECDLVFFLDGGIFAHDDRVADAFQSGYGRIATDPGLLAYYRYARALEDFVAFLDDAVDETSAAESSRWIEAQFGSRGVVELADRSYAQITG